MTTETTAEYAGPAILELMGHRRAAGNVREVTIAGAGFLRLDIPATNGHGPQTQYISPGSLYALHPCGEEEMLAAAGRFRPEPASRWELRAIDAPSHETVDDGDDNEHGGDPF